MLILRKPWTEQPKTFRRIDGRWTSRLVAAHNFAAPTNKNQSVFGTVATEASLGGIGPRFAANGSNYFTQTIDTARLLGPITVCASFTRKGSGTGSSDNVILMSDCTSNWFGMPYMLSVLNTGELQLGRSSSTFDRRSWIKTTEQPSAVDKVVHVVARSNTSNAGSGLASLTQFWVNGAKLTSTVAYEDVASGAVGSTSTTAYVGRAATAITANAYSANAILHGYAIFETALSDGECRDLSESIWRIYEPRHILVPVSTAGYTHPTLSNARMGSLTTTGGVPLVDYAF